MKYLFIFLLLSNVAMAQYLADDDYDNDGVINLYDWDDDNDGILDCEEAQTVYTHEDLMGPEIFINPTMSYEPTNPNIGVHKIFDGGTVYNQGASYTEVNTGSSTSISPILVIHADTTHPLQEVSGFILYNDAGLPSNSIKEFTVTVSTYDGGAHYYSFTSSATPSFYDFRQEFYFNTTYEGVTHIKIRVLSKVGSVPVHITEVGLIGSTCVPQDTDGDGIDNLFDLDSDNDGCWDALEGSASIDYSQLQNQYLLGSVDANGVPIIANGGQSSISEKNVNLMSQVCSDTQVWNCEDELYQLYNGKQIVKLDTQQENYNSVLSISEAWSLSTLSYNSSNNKIYGFATHNEQSELVMLGKEGSIFPLGLESIENWIGSTIDQNHHLYLMNVSGALYSIDLASDSLELIALNQSFENAQDIVYDSASSSLLGVAPLGVLYKYTIGSNEVETTALSGSIAQEVGDFGALWITTDGVLFTYNNTSGKIYNINLSTGIGFESLQTTANLQQNDGFSCADSTAPLETIGDDGFDNDGDGLTDCADADQMYNPFCITEICDNGIDDDGDGAIDCQDGDCYSSDSSCTEICDNGVDDDGDGLIDAEDDQCYSSSSALGGLESNDRLSQKIAQRNYKQRLYLNEEYLQKIQGNHAFLKNGNGTFGIEDCIPTQLGGLYASNAAPMDLVEITNAVEVASADYYLEGSRVGSVLGILTENGVYEHSKYICDRLGGATLQNVSYMWVDDLQLFVYELISSEGNKEFATNLVAYETAEGFVQENYWNSYQYPIEDRYYNLQIWANGTTQLLQLVEAVLEEMQTHAPFVGSNSGNLPRVFVQKGKYKNGILELTIRNKSQATEVQLIGAAKNTELALSEELTQTFALSGAAIETFSMDTGFIYDYGFTLMSENNVNDDLFFADGTWLSDESHSGVGAVEFEIIPQQEIEIQEDMYLLERSISVEAQVKTYYNVSRSISPKYTGENLSMYDYLAFTASGNGMLQVTLVKEGYGSWEEQFRLQITLNETETDYQFSWSDFESITHSSLDLNDVVMVVFSLVGDGITLENRFLTIENLRFTHTENLNTEEVEFQALSLYPNPAFETVYLQTDKPIEGIEMYSLEGQVVKRIDIEMGSGRVDWNISDLQEGIYFVKVNFANQAFKTYKLIKK